MRTRPWAFPKLLQAGILASALSACGSESNQGDREPDAGSPGPRPSDEQCEPSTELDQVLAPDALPGVTRIDHLQLDETHVYLTAAAGTGATLFRVAIEGGSARELLTDPGSYSLPVSVRNDHVLVATSQAIVRFAKADGATREVGTLPAAPAGDFFTGQQAFVFGSDAAYFADDAGTLHAIALDSGAARTLGSAAEVPYRIALAGDTLYWSESVADADAKYINALKGVSTSDGEARDTEVNLGAEVQLGFDVIAGTDGAIFLDVTGVFKQGEQNPAESVTAQGIYRQPLDGSAALQLTSAPAIDFADFFGLPTSEVVPVGGEVFVRKGTVQTSTLYSIGSDATEPTRRLCVDLDELVSISTIAVQDDVLYLALSDGEAAWIVKHDL